MLYHGGHPRGCSQDETRRRILRSPFLAVTACLLVIAWIAGASASARSSHGFSRVAMVASSPSSPTVRPDTVDSIPRWGPTDQLVAEVRPASPPPAPVKVPAPTKPAAPPAVRTVAHPISAPATAASAPSPSGYGCAAALAWLKTHSAPGFVFECPAAALGHQAMTCVNVAGVCPGERLITIAVPCRAAYMNEAHNSWIAVGLVRGSWDPYGYCH